jgi:hypothetical protein
VNLLLVSLYCALHLRYSTLRNCTGKKYTYDYEKLAFTERNLHCCKIFQSAPQLLSHTPNEVAPKYVSNAIILKQIDGVAGESCNIPVRGKGVQAS